MDSVHTLDFPSKIHSPLGLKKYLERVSWSFDSDTEPNHQKTDFDFNLNMYADPYLATNSLEIWLFGKNVPNPDLTLLKGIHKTLQRTSVEGIQIWKTEKGQKYPSYQ